MPDKQITTESPKQSASGFSKLLYGAGGFIAGGIVGQVASNVLGLVFGRAVMGSLEKEKFGPAVALGGVAIVLSLGGAIMGAVKGVRYANKKEAKAQEAQRTLEEIKQTIAQQQSEHAPIKKHVEHIERKQHEGHVAALNTELTETNASIAR